MNPTFVKPKILIPFRLLSRVSFGLSVLVLTGAYVAAGAMRPWLGGWFDRTDYFNLWPLKVLLVLLLANVVTMTWRRVPLKRAWFGVWCINAGILILIGAWSLHLSHSVDGSVRLYLDSSVGPMTVDRFYDREQRSLFIRLGQEAPVEIPLPTLQRFVECDRAKQFADRGLIGIEPGVQSTDPNTGKDRIDNLAELIGCTGQKLQVDVVGFYPNAELSTDFRSDANSQTIGVKLTTTAGVRWVVGSDPRFRVIDDFAGAEFQHLEVDDTSAAGVIETAEKLRAPDAGAKSKPGDPFQLLPVRKKVRHTFLTPPGGKELVDIAAGTGRETISVQHFADGVKDLVLGDSKIHIERSDRIHLADKVVRLSPSGPAEADIESNQVVSLKLSIGEWSTILNVPFAKDAAEHLVQDQWRGGVVKPPGAVAPLQFQLGNSTRPLPTAITLLESKGIADPVYTFSITDPTTGSSDIKMVRLNDSIYCSGGRWVFSPTAYDADQKWIQMKIESRPALRLMISGGGMVLLGALYSAFARFIPGRTKRVVI